MKLLLAAIAVAVLIGAAPITQARAQSEMDHRVQRAWDDVFNPPPPGDPRTNWERHRDNVRRRAQAANHARWCGAHPAASSCDRSVRRN